MLVTFANFSGVAPKLSPYKLPQSFAKDAANIRTARGTLAPWMQPLTVISGLSAAPKSTIYRYGQDLVSDTQYWFHWTRDCDVIKGAIAGDQTERTYFFNATDGFRQTNNSLALTGGSGDYPWASYPVGVPFPTSAPTASASGGAAATPESRVYVFTYVTAWGEEGAPSDASNVVEVNPGGTVTLTGLGNTAPIGYPNITAKRLYRSLTGNTSTDLYFLDEIPVTQATYSDTKDSQYLGELIPSLTYDAPPTSSLRGIAEMANGIMLAFTDYDVCPSEAYLPYAYPEAYRQAISFKFVGAASFGASCVICTTANPYMLSGTSPSSLALQKLESEQGCASKRSIAAVGPGVVYASPDGLVFVDGSGGVQVVTEALISRDEWIALNPYSIHGYAHDGRYIGFYDNGTTQGGFVWEPRAGDDKALIWLDLYATAGYSDPLQDALYLKIGTEIRRWHAGGTPMTYRWRSRPVQLPGATSFAWGKVQAETYPVTMKLYKDGVLALTQTVANKRPFRLPAGRSEFVEVEFSGTGEIVQAWLATSADELRQGA